jgi:KUP system potassium uptake protein
MLPLTALGVVFGDIGTSPLYAFRAAFHPEHGLQPTRDTVLGVLSLIVWALILIVAVKYVMLVMRADNRGEGGILALLALVPHHREALILLGVFGAALLYGDGVITPAISVLGAVEGLGIAAPTLSHWIVPLAVLILVLLFLVQKRGTALVGIVFGPIMLAWFAAIAALGGLEIAQAPGVLAAINPWYGVRLLLGHGFKAFTVLGAVVLAVTGAEALYADMGHFGRRPIRVAWFAVVLPALLLNYLGQGALLLRVPEAVQNPFYLLAPGALLYPLLVIATLAAVIASQALISGAFSLTQQSIQLGFAPRLTIVHTSRAIYGQIYVPEVNAALMVGCLLLVVGFGSASALGAAYGIAVTGTMAITTVLLSDIAQRRWRWSPLRTWAVVSSFLAIELAFLGANVSKIARGGWVPIAIGVGAFTLMTTWNRGTRALRHALADRSVPLDRFFAELDALEPPRVPGTAVFLTAHVEGTPEVLRLHLRHNKALHEEVIFLSVLPQEVPEVPDETRLTVEPLGRGFYRAVARYGFMETPDVRSVVARCCASHLRAQPDDVTYYVGRPQLLPTGPARMAKWRKLVFAFMARNARPVTQFFNLPVTSVVEIGAQVEL